MIITTPKLERSTYESNYPSRVRLFEMNVIQFSRQQPLIKTTIPKVNLPYDEYAKIYNEVIYGEDWKAKGKQIADSIIKILHSFSERKIVRILDVACGTGIPAIDLAKLGYDVVGIDINKQMLKILKRNGKHLKNLKFIRMDWNEISKENFDGSFDAILYRGSSILHNKSLDDVVNLLRRFRYLLKKGGLLYITVMDMDNFLGELKENKVEFASGMPIMKNSSIYVPIYKWDCANGDLVLNFIFLKITGRYKVYKQVFQNHILKLCKPKIINALKIAGFNRAFQVENPYEVVRGNKQKVYLAKT